MGEPELVPRSQYVMAQAVAESGRLDEARRLIETAKEAWLGLGQEDRALRSNVGLIHVLTELG